ncbi:SMI1/KNR4 family protein [Yinghuangia sp. YIM S09857]|uniref:SMI1/KNR4 family protein n=1 Tax=Yinghuangia sp. YIM S09857 TaxID=3436929 RepID=UPI003F537A3B
MDRGESVLFSRTGAGRKQQPVPTIHGDVEVPSNDWVGRLAEAVGLPESLDFFVDWGAAESALGAVLPSDYKRAVEYFGSGEFDGYIGFLVPFSENSLLDLQLSNDELNAVLERHPNYREFYSPYAVYPQSGGLLDWAYCGYGQRFYWLTDGDDPDRWPVIAWQDRGHEKFRFDGSTSEFLYRLLTEDLEIDFIPERRIEGPLTFRQ